MASLNQCQFIGNLGADPETKACAVCSTAFAKRARDSQKQWARRSFCSCACANVVKKAKGLEAAFWGKVVKTQGGCWEWTTPRDAQGYGHIQHNGKRYKAHRLSYLLNVGPFPAEQVICHRCDNPPCCNPEHLFAGTQSDNAQDMVRKGRMNPVSQLNLRAGRRGFHGAGPQSRKDALCLAV